MTPEPVFGVARELVNSSTSSPHIKNEEDDVVDAVDQQRQSNRPQPYADVELHFVDVDWFPDGKVQQFYACDRF
jgi:hypothetical protein